MIKAFVAGMNVGYSTHTFIPKELYSILIAIPHSVPRLVDTRDMALLPFQWVHLMSISYALFIGH